MAEKHTEIEVQVQQDWTKNKRGRLFRNDNGWCKTVGRYGLGVGTSDLIGFELINDNPIFCVIEVKTKAHKYLTEEQILFLNHIKNFGGRAYVAMETDEGYKLTEWEGK